MTPVMQLQELTRDFKILRGAMGKGMSIRAVNKVSLSIRQGETLGLVGESGCGKSTIGKMLTRLLPASSGSILFQGKDVTGLSNGQFRPYRRNIQIVFQDPYSSLNPRMSIFEMLRRPLSIFGIEKSRSGQRKMILDTLELVGLKPEHMSRYPHEFSGGQRQRIAVARAILTRPEFVVLDEPTSALDVSVQAQIMNLLKKLKTELQLTYLFISHDLSVVRFISDRIAVMYLGYLVELAGAEDLFAKTLHPYTQLLFRSIPIADPSRPMSKDVDYGEVPSLIRPPSGCPFSTRCPKVMARCNEQPPTLVEAEENHQVACYLYHA